jgi:hypothetical protein
VNPDTTTFPSPPIPHSSSLSVPDPHKSYPGSKTVHPSSDVPPHTPPSKIDPDLSLVSSNNIFGSNEFAVACAGKIKFSKMENTLKTKKLENDTIEKLEKFYSQILILTTFNISVNDFIKVTTC